VYVGQQLDVFIETGAAAKISSPTQALSLNR